MRQEVRALGTHLRQAEPKDISALARLRSDEGVQGLLLTHPEAREADDTADWIDRRGRDPHGFFWVIESRGECVGFAQLTNRHRLDRHATFGIGLLPEARGNGTGRAAMNQLIANAKELGLRKLLCQVRCDNTVAVALYETLGFRKVGILRDHYDDGKRQWDVILMEFSLESTSL